MSTTGHIGATEQHASNASIAAALEALRINRPLRAEEICREYLHRSPGSVEHLRLLGHALGKQGRYVDAERTVRLAISLRSQILRVQDRLIRLEMRLRMQQLLPQELRDQIDRIGVKQLVALRFASDAELAELTRQVLSGSLATQNDIKAKIRDWQGDFLRA